MVAIAVVGSTFVFVFAETYFGQTQISGTPTIEALDIVGYDARDVDQLKAHDNVLMPIGTGGDPSIFGKNTDERVVVYVKNDSVNQVYFTEIRLAGVVYDYFITTTVVPDGFAGTAPGQKEYSVLTDAASILQEQAAVMSPGETVTILIDLDEDFPIGRDAQFKLTTTNGAIFVSTIVMGQNSGW